MLPAMVRGTMDVEGADDPQTVVEEYVLGLKSTEALELSDLVDAVYDAGATKVTFPFTLVVLSQATDRTWHASVAEDSAGNSRIQHFMPDDGLVVS